MAFHMTHAFAVAGVMIAALVSMAISNRRSGWRRERRDIVLENVELWARTVASEPAPEAVPDPVAAPAVTFGLAALHAALQEPDRPVLPAGTPTPTATGKQESGEQPAKALAATQTRA